MSLVPTDGSGGGLQNRPTLDEVSRLIDNAVGRITNTVIAGIRDELRRAMETVSAVKLEERISSIENNVSTVLNDHVKQDQTMARLMRHLNL